MTWHNRPSADLDERLQIFVEAGLLNAVPTWWQEQQGTLEMTPWVLSPDVTNEGQYRDSLWAKPVVRQPFLAMYIGLDHFATGSGLKMKLSSICRHLQLTWHDGMPVFDLQVIQSHENGLEIFRQKTLELIADETPEARRQNQIARRLFPDPVAYYRLFTDPGGYIDRAQAFDYPTAEQQNSKVPAHFFSLVGFLQHCADNHPATRREVGLMLPARVARLALQNWIGPDAATRAPMPWAA